MQPEPRIFFENIEMGTLQSPQLPRSNRLRDNAQHSPPLIPSTPLADHRIRFGPFEIDPHTRELRRRSGISLSAIALCVATNAGAQFDPARAYVEPPSIAARYPDPDVTYRTPAFIPGRQDFTTHGEVIRFAEDLARRSPHARLEIIGRSQRGLAMPMLVMTRSGVIERARPTVLIIGQQHGNEPAGGEAVLAVAERLAGAEASLLDRVNVLLIPRGNPDGADRFVRVTANGIDVNRDHLLLQTPEARAIASVTLQHHPQVVLDLHEFTVGGRWIDKFGVVERYDALLQAATVGNLDPGIASIAQTGFIDRLHRVLADGGLSSFHYHTTSGDSKDKAVAMGGVQPDTGRNVNGLRPAISMLIEVRGIGLGRAHLLRRVHAQTVAALTVIAVAADQGPRLLALVDDAGKRTAAQACRGELTIDARQSVTRKHMDFLDAASGADRNIDVEWRAAMPLAIVRSRPRPCGYVLGADQAEAIERLRLLGARMSSVLRPARWEVERYEIVSEDDGIRQDARGAIEDAQPIRALQVRTVRSREAIGPEMIFVPLNQPLAPLIAAALEPDSQNSYAANRLLDPDRARLRRVMRRPAASGLRSIQSMKLPAR